ncbi:MAG: hypothetical protein JJU34_10855 [Lunatimonas sp.]|uniref:hypothetical protein n=1 Tax=Lunatimonas sp. TaxID=2060141 RepID=UPI00263B7F45|nr:hypothetical protein [Lunatimonas sp.]MCC5937770.1 hypothetical protein [Lunatimonas sp.]
MKAKFFIPIILLSFVLASCESEEERQRRLARKEQQRIELEERRKAEETERVFKLEQERIAEETKREQERQEKAIYDRYINNSLSSGSAPYAYCFGSNKSCSDWGCSEIKVRASNNSDVLVTIKKDDVVVRHAYIRAGGNFTFQLPNGTYQPFFYYGKGWNPEKIMKQTKCGTLKGGFIDEEVFGKDGPQILSNDILTYELVLQKSGNFSTKPSNVNEAF